METPQTNDTLKNTLTPEHQKQLLQAIDDYISIPTGNQIKQKSKKQTKRWGHEKFTPKNSQKRTPIPTSVPLRQSWLPELEIFDHRLLMIEYDDDPIEKGQIICPQTASKKTNAPVWIRLFLCPQKCWENFIQNTKKEWQQFLQIVTINQEGACHMFFPNDTGTLAVLPARHHDFEIIPAESLVLTTERRKKLETAMEEISSLFWGIKAQTPAEASQSHPETQPPSQTPCSKPPNPFLPQESG